MDLQQKIYHEKIYQNLARANARRAYELQKQKVMHQQLLAHYERDIYQNQIDSKRLKFRNFVAQKLQEQRLLRGIDQQVYHQEYIQRIDKLRKQRQKLINNNLSYHPVPHNNQIQQNDHILICDKEKLSSQMKDHSKVYLNTQKKPKNRSIIEQTNFLSDDKAKNQLKFTKNQDLDQKIFYNSVLADQLYNRWVPYDQRDNIQQKINEKQFKQTEEHLRKIQKWHNQIKQRKINLQKHSNAHNYLNNSYDNHHHNHQQNQNVSFVKQSNKNNGILIQDDYQMTNDEVFRSMKPANVSKKSEKKKKIDKSLNNQSMVQNLNNAQYHIKKLSKENRTRQQNAAMKKIRNRLTLSTVVYEDSEYRNIVHQKTHLANKFAAECKMRKDILTKICTHKIVGQKYKNVSLACTQS